MLGTKLRPKDFSRYWNDISNQRTFLESLSKKLNITDPEGWYKISREAVIKHGGSRILKKYNDSLSKLLTTVYPQYPTTTRPLHLCMHKWYTFKFSSTVPRGYWNDISNQRSFLEYLAKTLNITDQEGWYQVTWNTWVHHGGETLLKKYNSSPYKLLSTLYPKYLDIYVL